MKGPFAFVALLPLFLCGCASSTLQVPTITSVTPSAAGTPHSVAVLGNYEFISVQGTGQIFTYNLSTGFQVLAVPPYATPCQDPSGMVLATIAGSTVMAVACYDTASLLTLTVHGDGSLTALGSVSGLPQPYPGIVLDGTAVYIPLFGKAASINGTVARVSIASPANPVITGSVAMASPAPGQYVNPSYLAMSGADLYAVAGSESAPQATSSTIQVVDKSSMTLIGSPLLVAHSPQQIAITGTVALVTLFDAGQLESIDISNPASLRVLQVVSLASANAGCHALPIAVAPTQFAYIGCYEERFIEQIDLTDPSNLRLTEVIPGVPSAQRILPAGQSLLVPSSVAGGSVYKVDLRTFSASN